MSDEAVEKKQIIKIRTNQSVSDCLHDPAWPSWYQEPVPPEYSCAGLARAGILLSAVFCWETWPGLSLGTGRPRESWHLSQWPESRVSGDLRLRHPGQEDNCQESVNRSSYVKLVHNWPGREGRSQEKCWDPAQFKDVTKLCSGVLAPNIQAGRLWIDWI